MYGTIFARTLNIASSCLCGKATPSDSICRSSAHPIEDGTRGPDCLRSALPTWSEHRLQSCDRHSTKMALILKWLNTLLLPHRATAPPVTVRPRYKNVSDEGHWCGKEASPQRCVARRALIDMAAKPRAPPRHPFCHARQIPRHSTSRHFQACGWLKPRRLNVRLLSGPMCAIPCATFVNICASWFLLP